MNVSNMMAVAHAIRDTLVDMKCSPIEFILIIKILDCYAQTEIGTNFFMEKEGTDEETR